MKQFKKYMHLERFGSTEVAQIELGECYVFPKIDGTNASVWFDDAIQAGSRTRQLSKESDNAGFYNWVLTQPNIAEYLRENPTHTLYGEWLVPHSLKTYRDDTWRKFYVFDVAIDKEATEVLHDTDDTIKYLHYNDYKPLLEKHGIDYIPPISIIKNADYEQLVNQLIKNVFLIKDGQGVGEGVVIKNYSFRNKYNRTTWAKIVTSEFKEKHAKEMGASEIKGRNMVEEEIAQEFVTTALCEKELAKIENEVGWNSKMIPRLLNTIYHEVIKEECWEFIKKHKNPTINFKTLQHFIFAQVKEKLPKYF
jgi:hypothetical protein